MKKMSVIGVLVGTARALSVRKASKKSKGKQEVYGVYEPAHQCKPWDSATYLKSINTVIDQRWLRWS
jgi:hypothetical protein